MANPVVIVGINAVDRTGKAVQSVQANFGKIGRTAGAAFTKVKVGATVALGAVTAVTAGVVKLTSAYAKMDLETGRIAKTTKATVKEVSSLRQEFKRFNLEADDVSDVLNEINVKLFDAQDEASAAAEAFNTLGLDASALADSGSYEALLEIADGLNQVESAADRAGAADAIFGGDLARRLLPVLEQGSEALRANAAEYERLGLVIDERAVAAAERFHAAQGRVNQAVEGLGRTVAAVALPYVTAFTNAFAGFLNQVPQLLQGQISLQTAFSTMFANLPQESQIAFGKVYLSVVTALQSGVNGIYDFAREGELVFHNMAGSVAKSFADGLNPIIEGANKIGALIPGFQPIDPITVDTSGFVSSIGDAPTIPVDAAIEAAAKRIYERQITKTIPGSGGDIYRVQAGDTYSDIALKTGLSVEQLRRQVGQPDRGLQIGTAIRHGGSGERTLTLNHYSAPLLQAWHNLQAARAGVGGTADYQGRVAAHQQGDFTQAPNFPDLTPTVGGLAIASLAGLGILNAADALLLRVPSRSVRAGLRVGRAVGSRLPNIYANRATQYLANLAATRGGPLASAALSQLSNAGLKFPVPKGGSSLLSKLGQGAGYLGRGALKALPVASYIYDMVENYRFLQSLDASGVLLDPTSEEGFRATGPNLGAVLAARQRLMDDMGLGRMFDYTGLGGPWLVRQPYASATGGLWTGHAGGYRSWPSLDRGSATGGLWTSNPGGYGPPPIIIENIHVADGEDFVDKVTDAWTEAWREGRLDEEAYRNR